LFIGLRIAGGCGVQRGLWKSGAFGRSEVRTLLNYCDKNGFVFCGLVRSAIAGCFFIFFITFHRPQL
jgi:hypothetical protein